MLSFFIIFINPEFARLHRLLIITAVVQICQKSVAFNGSGAKIHIPISVNTAVSTQTLDMNSDTLCLTYCDLITLILFDRLYRKISDIWDIRYAAYEAINIRGIGKNICCIADMFA